VTHGRRTPAPRRRRTSLAVALVTLFAFLAGCGSASPRPRPAPVGVRRDIPEAVHADDGLAISLLQRLGSGGGNVVFSPYSIETALSMVGAGAAGSTATEIDHVLDTTRPAAVAAGLAAVEDRLSAASRSPGGPRIELANGLWVQSGLALRKPFTQTLSSRFGAPPRGVDFRAAPDAARQSINAWVAARTAHLITNLFPADTITSQTALVLANAIHLAARWANPFVSSETAPGPFYTGAGATVQAPFMAQAPVELSYTRGNGYQAIDLPYAHSSLSMLVVMPAPGTLARFEQSLGTASVARVDRALRPTRVALQMPKFHLSFDTGLVPVLSELGMPIAFSDAADFSGITSQTALKISAVQHAANLRVDEQGTIAAAATGIAVEPTAIPVAPATRLTLDHPFLLFLRDDASGAILFVGQVTNPV